VDVDIVVSADAEKIICAPPDNDNESGRGMEYQIAFLVPGTPFFVDNYAKHAAIFYSQCINSSNSI
jgi:hypothetical protein